MSQILYLASNCPLAEIKNPHYKMLSVSEALAIGMENIPESLCIPPIILIIKAKIQSDFLLEIRRDLSVCTPDTIS